MSVKPATMRLDRLLGNLGYGSRREMAFLAAQGRLQVDGMDVADVAARITLSQDLPARLRVDDGPLDPLPGMALMLHKPVGVTCSHKEAGRLVYDLLPARWRRRDPPLSTVGRLDKETSGLLLLTDDGALLHKIISPKSHVSKQYQVELARPLSGKESGVLSAGTLMLEGEDKPLLPVEMQVHGPCRASVVLHEGRYHQVRRVFAALGNHVTALHRDRIGGLELPAGLSAGEFVVMGEQEIAAVLER